MTPTNKWHFPKSISVLLSTLSQDMLIFLFQSVKFLLQIKTTKQNNILTLKQTDKGKVLYDTTDADFESHTWFVQVSKHFVICDYYAVDTFCKWLCNQNVISVMYILLRSDVLKNIRKSANVLTVSIHNIDKNVIKNIYKMFLLW